MNALERMAAHGHESVVFASNVPSGYRAIIAIHSTRLGPALGGTRLWPYASEDSALADVLRLAEGMTYKAAAAGMPFGGGKAVLIADPASIDRSAVFRAHGRAVDRLAGRYITSIDIGTGPDDMVHVHEETRYAAGLPAPFGSPAPGTARGVQRAIEAALLHTRGSADLAGRTVAIQGCGAVGALLAKGLHAGGAKLIVSDVDTARVAKVARESGARIVRPEEIHTADVDVFAPCAFGAGLSETTIPQLRCRAIAGAANNQLATPVDGVRLTDRGIAYAPDFIANAGGLIYLGQEVLGWSSDRVTASIDRIFDTVGEVFRRAAERHITTHEAAVALAKERL